MNSLQSFYETTGDTYCHLLPFLRSDSQCIEQIPDEILVLQDSEKETIENGVANGKDCESTVTTVRLNTKSITGHGSVNDQAENLLATAINQFG